MAIMIDGKTRCGICGEVIDGVMHARAFPAFLHRDHRFAKFSDAVFHSICFDSCTEKDGVEDVFAKYQSIWEQRPRTLRTLAEIEAWGKDAFHDL